MRFFYCSIAAAAATLAAFSFAPASAADWSGCYGGVNLGVGRASSTTTDLPFQEGPYAGFGLGWNSASETVVAKDSGITGGAALGCDRQIAPIGNGVFVLGGLLDLSVLNAGRKAAFSGTGSDTLTSFKVKNAASLRLRAGYAQERMLVYVTGGLARGQIDVAVKDSTPPATMQVSGAGAKSGWVAGFGIEWALAENRSLDISLLHYDFGKVTVSSEARDPAGAFPRFQHDVKADVLRVGMNWYF